MKDGCLEICPCCKRPVDRVEARSIFDFKVKICKRCAFAEKSNIGFNWIKVNEVEE